MARDLENTHAQDQLTEDVAEPAAVNERTGYFPNSIHATHIYGHSNGQDEEEGGKADDVNGMTDGLTGSPQLIPIPSMARVIAPTPTSCSAAGKSREQPPLSSSSSSSSTGVARMTSAVKRKECESTPAPVRIKMHRPKYTG